MLSPISQTRSGEPPHAPHLRHRIPFQGQGWLGRECRGDTHYFPPVTVPWGEDDLTPGAGDAERSAFLSFQSHDVQALGEKRIYFLSPLVLLSNHRPERANSFT